MHNLWKEIALDDYESHMRLDSVMQLQALNRMMKKQLWTYDISSVMILGIAGGNGLNHIQKKEKFKKVYGIDVNPSYLDEVLRRYGNMNGILECLCINLINEADQLPNADLIIANLIIEYIGYKCFKNVIKCVNPKYISCIIQINEDNNFVSHSPYLHKFDCLGKIHHQIEEYTLKKSMYMI